MSLDANVDVNVSAEEPPIGPGERFAVSLFFVIGGVLAAFLLFDLLKNLWLGRA